MDTQNRFTKSQAALLKDIAEMVGNESQVKYMVIQQRPNMWPIHDPLSGCMILDTYWVKGYAKSAKALVQCGILIQEAHTCYSLTEYGKEVIKDFEV